MQQEKASRHSLHILCVVKGSLVGCLVDDLDALIGQRAYVSDDEDEIHGFLELDLTHCLWFDILLDMVVMASSHDEFVQFVEVVWSEVIGVE